MNLSSSFQFFNEICQNCALLTSRIVYFYENAHFVQGVFFNWASPKKTKSKIMLEYPDWASPGPRQKVKVHGLGLP